MTSTTEGEARASNRRIIWRWRVVDIVVAAVLGVAAGVIFWAWNVGYQPLNAALYALFPPLVGLTAGPWLFAGVLGGLIIRKPGAALFVEIVAAFFSMLFGAQWGVDTLVSGVLQGLGAEIVFAAFLYRRFGLGVAMLAGAAAGLLEVPHELIVWYPGFTPAMALVFAISMVASGAVIAGIGSWLIARGLAATGVLQRFAMGRERSADV